MTRTYVQSDVAAVPVSDIVNCKLNVNIIQWPESLSVMQTLVM